MGYPELHGSPKSRDRIPQEGKRMNISTHRVKAPKQRIGRGDQSVRTKRRRKQMLSLQNFRRAQAKQRQDAYKLLLRSCRYTNVAGCTNPKCLAVRYEREDKTHGETTVTYKIPVPKDTSNKNLLAIPL